MQFNKIQIEFMIYAELRILNALIAPALLGGFPFSATFCKMGIASAFFILF